MYKTWEFEFETHKNRIRLNARGTCLGQALESALDEIQTGGEALRENWKLEHLIKVKEVKS